MGSHHFRFHYGIAESYLQNPLDRIHNEHAALGNDHAGHHGWWTDNRRDRERHPSPQYRSRVR